MNIPQNLKIIIITFALCILAFLSGQYFSRKPVDKATPTTINSSVNIPTPPEVPKTSDLPTNDASTSVNDSDKGYIVIEDWNVRFKEGDLTQDVEYLVKDEHTLYLTTKAYVSKAGNGSCKKDGSTGYLVRGKAGFDYNDSGNGIENLSYSYKNSNGSNVTVSSKKIGDFYYFWVNPQAPCADPDKMSYDQQSMYQKALRDLVDTIQESSPNLAGWQNFSSKYFTLSFKIPPGFEVVENNFHLMISKKPYEKFTLAEDTAFFYLTRYGTTYSKEGIQNSTKDLLSNTIVSDIVIDGTKFTQLVGNDEPADSNQYHFGKETIVLLDKSWIQIVERPNSKDVDSNWYAGNSPTQLGNKILATLKFSK